MQSLLGDIHGRALWVVVGCLVCQMGLGFVYSFAPLAGDLIAEFGWTRAQYSSARASQIWVIALASPAVGFLTVRYGGRAVLSISAVLLGVAFVGIGAMQSWLQFALLTVALGLAVTGLGDIAVGAVAAQWVQRSRGLALGLVYTGSNLGGWLVSRAAASIAEASGWREAFTLIGVGGALFVLPFALLAVRDRPGAGAAGAAEVAAGAEDPRRDLDVWAALRTRSFWVIALTLFAIFFFLVAVLEHLVLYLVDAGMQRSAATGFYSNMIAMGLISKVAFGLIADRLRAKTALVIDFALLTASSLVLPFATEGALLWVFVIGFGFAYAARDVVTPLIVADCFGVKYLAQIYGALMVTLLPAGTLGPIFAALVHDRTGSYDAAFATFAAVNGLSLAAIGLLRDERRPH